MMHVFPHAQVKMMESAVQNASAGVDAEPATGLQQVVRAVSLPCGVQQGTVAGSACSVAALPVQVTPWAQWAGDRAHKVKLKK